jgi:hypothetical protein
MSKNRKETREDWTKEELLHLVEAVKELGPNWRQIEDKYSKKLFSGRDNQGLGSKGRSMGLHKMKTEEVISFNLIFRNLMQQKMKSTKENMLEVERH